MVLYCYTKYCCQFVRKKEIYYDDDHGKTRAKKVCLFVCLNGLIERKQSRKQSCQYIR